LKRTSPITREAAPIVPSPFLQSQARRGENAADRALLLRRRNNAAPKEIAYRSAALARRLQTTLQQWRESALRVVQDRPCG
jgi:hypothetical protein